MIDRAVSVSAMNPFPSNFVQPWSSCLSILYFFGVFLLVRGKERMCQNRIFKLHIYWTMMFACLQSSPLGLLTISREFICLFRITMSYTHLGCDEHGYLSNFLLKCPGDRLAFLHITIPSVSTPSPERWTRAVGSNFSEARRIAWLASMVYKWRP